MRDVRHRAVARQFTDRWSSRAYDGVPLTQEQIDTLLEAARWAPSSYNDQPWHFFYPKTAAQQEQFLGLLAEGNQKWAHRAGVLFFLASRRVLRETGEQNRHYAFDAGAAWMSLALQAHLDGLSAHAMGGFDEDRAYGVLGIAKEEYEIFAAIAIGKPTQQAVDSEDRTSRRSIADISDAV